MNITYEAGSGLFNKIKLSGGDDMEKNDKKSWQKQYTKAEGGQEEPKDKEAEGEEGVSLWRKAISGTGAWYEKAKKYPYFAGGFCVGVGIMVLALCFLPVIVVVPRKFSLLMNFGMICVLASFAYLKGWYQFFIKDLLINTK